MTGLAPGELAPGTARPRPRRRRRAGLVVGLTLAVLLVLVLVAALWVVLRGLSATAHLSAGADGVPALRQALLAGDDRLAVARAESLRSDMAEARRLTGDPVWAAATHLPGIGDDLATVRTVADIGDGLATGAVVPLAGPDGLGRLVSARAGAARQGPAALVPVLAQLRDPLSRADREVDGARTRLSALDTTSVDGRIATPVAVLRDQLARTGSQLDDASRAAVLVPALLAPDRPRTYLVLCQNLSEARSRGGISGAYVVLRAEAGRLTLLSEGAGADVGPFRTPVLDPGEQGRAVFGDRPQRYLQDVTADPWFPVGARTAREMIRRETGLSVDGVLATDPVLLGQLIDVTGPVRLPGGRTATGSAISRLLLSDVYRLVPDPAGQDRFFAGAASAAFGVLTGFRGDPLALARAAAPAVAQGRLLVWDPRPEVTAAIAGTVLEGVPGSGSGAGGGTGSSGAGGAGTDLTRTGTRRPLVGVYLNDGGGSKLSWYLRRSASVTDLGRGTGGQRRLRLDLALGSVAPAEGLPEYVYGPARYGVPGGSQRVTVYVVGSGSVVSATLDGVGQPLAVNLLRGRPVGTTSLDIAPGATRHLRVELLAPPGTAVPDLELQPLAH